MASRDPSRSPVTTADPTLREQALRYHSEGRRGKIEVRYTKPTRTQSDLALAYSPGVAEPCLEIERDPECSFDYTARGNLVAVITNGTAVLGLGDIGPAAAKPVMEGKGVLFKRFADIDVFDIELNAPDPERFIDVVKALSGGFGGINLEDIKAPECYEIERRLRGELDIPVFHDDQHGTAIISSAALINALELVGKALSKVRIVVSGAGAAAIACANLFISLGAQRERILLVDSKGVIYRGRSEGMNEYKQAYAAETSLRTLEEAMVDADVFVGLSVAGLVTPDMVRSMAVMPIIFALANPDPEISYPEALAARPDVIAGTGRSDYPNQINNVLGFPFIFRGALDVQAREINEEMKLAAVHALARLAKEIVPEEVSEAYGNRRFVFGREYLIPKPLDPRALSRVASAVAGAAMESGVARQQLDLDAYRDRLENLLGGSRRILREMVSRARRGHRCRIVFPEGDAERVVLAAQRIVAEDIGRPVLLGDVDRIQERLSACGCELEHVDVIDAKRDPKREEYARRLFQLRRFKGLRASDADALMTDSAIHFGLMMLKEGDADCLLSGIRHTYPEVLRPALQIIRVQDWLTRCAGLYILSVRDRVFYFADTTVNIDPTAEELAEIAICTAQAAEQFGSTPRVALLSFSNSGSVDHPRANRVREAVRIARQRAPELSILGEIQADAAIDRAVRRLVSPESAEDADANVLIFPDLDSANIAYKLMMKLGGAQGIGPIILGMRRPVNVIPQEAGVEEIVEMAAVLAVRAKAESLQV